MQATRQYVVLVVCSLFICSCVSTAQKATVEVSVGHVGLTQNIAVIIHGALADSNPWQCVKEEVSRRFNQSDIPVPESSAVFVRSIYKQSAIAEISLSWRLVKKIQIVRAEKLLKNIVQINCR